MRRMTPFTLKMKSIEFVLRYFQGKNFHINHSFVFFVLFVANPHILESNDLPFSMCWKLGR